MTKTETMTTTKHKLGILEGRDERLAAEGYLVPLDVGPRCPLTRSAFLTEVKSRNRGHTDFRVIWSELLSTGSDAELAATTTGRLRNAPCHDLDL